MSISYRKRISIIILFKNCFSTINYVFKTLFAQKTLVLTDTEIMVNHHTRVGVEKTGRVPKNIGPHCKQLAVSWSGLLQIVKVWICPDYLNQIPHKLGGVDVRPDTISSIFNFS